MTLSLIRSVDVASDDTRPSFSQIALVASHPVIWPHPAAAGDVIVLYPNEGQAFRLHSAPPRISEQWRPFSSNLNSWSRLAEMLQSGAVRAFRASDEQAIVHWLFAIGRLHAQAH